VTGRFPTGKSDWLSTRSDVPTPFASSLRRIARFGRPRRGVEDCRAGGRLRRRGSSWPPQAGSMHFTVTQYAV